jgi:hypothetical protein
MAEQEPAVHFRNSRVQRELDARSASGLSPGQVAARDLERYYRLLELELQAIDLSEGEAMLLCDAFKDALMEPHTLHVLWAEIHDAIRMDGLDRKWNVDSSALVEKLHGLSPAGCTALVDAVERFWLDPNAEGRLQAVGFQPG